ncbi:PREDICTED: membrane [Prunus dulcis]|uniref:PREDICTED: membrane n=1 Tax=Prunus dulcis TaxID=3755 RepID=A0A5E4ERY9_PRUDU|nr:PREDICTED: membrane [Prunus dulcis]
MEPPKGVLASLWNFICFLPYFIGLLLLGNFKGILFCPLICLIMTIGNSAIILGLWPVHFLWTYYCMFRAKRYGPALKIVVCIFVLPVQLILWPVVGIVGSIVGGAAYGFLSPVMETFQAVGEGKTNQLYHCFYDGIWSTVQGCFTVVRDFGDVCYHTYFSVMDDLREQGPPDAKYYEIRVLYLPGAVIISVLGFMVDMPVISFIALCKSPYMLFKGWHRLFHDLIGREGPFLETICVPFAVSFLVLLLEWLFIRSPHFGWGYAISLHPCPYMMNTAMISLTCQKDPAFQGQTTERRPNWAEPTLVDPLSQGPAPSEVFPPARFHSLILSLSWKPLELMDSLFKECKHHGEIMVSEGLITLQDIEDAKSSKGSRVISIGLPAYCLLQALLRSAKANSVGILLSDNVTELTSSNRPKETFFDWFFHPLLIIEDQIKAENLSEAEEAYLCKLVLLNGDPLRSKNSNIGSAPESERKQAELDAFARRLQGITKSISRYPTFRRRFENLVNAISDDLAQNDGSSKPTDGPKTIPRSKSAFAQLFSQKSFSFTNKTSNHGYDPESQTVVNDVTITQ